VSLYAAIPTVGRRVLGPRCPGCAHWVRSVQPVEDETGDQIEWLELDCGCRLNTFYWALSVDSFILTNADGKPETLYRYAFLAV
jgi:hypothetical protein